MIEKKTVVDKLEITSGGEVQIRLGLLLVEDGAEIDRKFHRTSIDTSTMEGGQMAFVNTHLTQMGWPSVDADGVAYIKRIVDAARF